MSSLNAIVVPLDGSHFAEQALDAATQLARSDGATLRLVMIHEPLTAWSSAGEYGDGSTALSDLTREQDLAYLEQAADQVRNATHLEV
ncbi:MAG: universal stress protein, partial [Gemmatimonadota bacterium]